MIFIMCANINSTTRNKKINRYLIKIKLIWIYSKTQYWRIIWKLFIIEVCSIYTEKLFFSFKDFNLWENILFPDKDMWYLTILWLTHIFCVWIIINVLALII